MREKLLFCTLCLITGSVVPMALLILGGILSVWSFGPFANQLAAYIVAGALLLMIGTYFLHRIATATPSSR